MRLNHLVRLGLGGAAVLAAGVGCGPTGYENARVDIQYEERLVCGCFTEGGSPETVQCAANDAYPRGAFIVYKIESVNNVDTQAKPFTFDPSNLIVNLSTADETPGQPIRNYNTAVPVTVAPKTIQPIFRRWILRVDDAGDPNQAHPLNYKNFLARNVAMVRFQPVAKVVKQVCRPEDMPPDGPGR